MSPSSPEFDAFGPQFVVGCDLGQAHDCTALAVVRKMYAETRRPVFQLGHLERLPLHTSYPNVVAHVGRLLARLPAEAELVIDHTGVGRPVYDLFINAGMSPIGVTITAGDVTTHDNLVFKVPKLHLVSRVQALLHSGQLKIHKDLAEAAALVEELQAFRASVTDSGYWRFGARAGKHDDLVLSLAIALWRSYGDGMEYAGMFEFYRQQSDLATSAAPDQKPEQPPLPPKPENPFDFYFVGNEKNPAPADVVLVAPPGTSAMTGLSGKLYMPDARGMFTVTAEDAKPLVAHGWQRVEQQRV